MFGKINKIIFVFIFYIVHKNMIYGFVIYYSYFIYNILPYSFNINTIRLINQSIIIYVTMLINFSIILIYACFS